ncbi:MAG: glutamate--cysteine ligase [Chlamydiae bacterium]|nr:glutamate--cysteine ligase [Chlamydiota bacterium]MBI3265453.1 glutamate--cysteine ligase [Chlamydiota bacterium]
MENNCLSHCETVDHNYLQGYFHRFVKKVPTPLLMGVESELLGVNEQTGLAIPYEGPQGIEGVLEGLIQRFGWVPLFEGKKMIALESDRGEIHLEPGAQLELSGLPVSSIWEISNQLRRHDEELKNVSRDKNIAWLPLGMQPFSPLKDIAWVPKGRYGVMRKYLGEKGTQAHCMMKQTATLQANLDYCSEEDAMKKFRTSLALAPVVTGLFANSPFLEGETPGPLSLRAQAWMNTDPDRCGLIQEVLEGDLNFESYIRYLLKIPMIFIIRDGKWLDMGGRTFEDFMNHGAYGFFPAPEDWELFLTSLFPEVRLNPFLELRSVDRNNLDFSLGLLAFWKGLLMDSRAYEAAWELMKNVSFEERVQFLNDASFFALKATLNNHSLQDLAKELISYAEKGLKRLSEDETFYLEPVKELIQEGISPAERLLKRWKGTWGHDPKKLIAGCRI